MTCDQFGKFLLKPPVYSEAIIKEVCPVDGWIGDVVFNRNSYCGYRDTLEKVRQLVEASAFRQSLHLDDGTDWVERKEFLDKVNLDTAWERLWI